MKSFLYIHIKTASFLFVKKDDYGKRKCTKGYVAVTSFFMKGMQIIQKFLRRKIVRI